MSDHWSDPPRHRVLVTGASGFIGTRLMQDLTSARVPCLGLDLTEPQDPLLRASHVLADVMDPDELAAVVRDWRPTIVAHLAARTDTLSAEVEDYLVNWEGTRNVLQSALVHGVEQFLHVSTQYVHALDSSPLDDDDYSPFTAYGQSKVNSERLLRERARVSEFSRWVIVRPTNVWGPRHPRYPSEFWRVLRRGMYVHPMSAAPVMRAYGYVGNVTWQLMKLMQGNLPWKRVYYVGDALIDLSSWVDAFSVGLRGRRARRVPAGLVRMTAKVGDLGLRAGLHPPLTTARFRNMVEPSAAPMEESLALLGSGPYSLEDGVRETLQWLDG